MKTWKAINTDNAQYIGIFEFMDTNGDWHNFEVLKTDTHLVFGGACNIGFLESGNMEIDDCLSLDENLHALLSDLETYYSDGKEYVTRIICNERM